MTALADNDLVTLAEAAKWVPGADAEALKRLARRGKLQVYRPCKAYLTTRADVQRMIESCRVEKKAHGYGSDLPAVTAPGISPTNLHGSSLMDHASAALDLALARLPKKRTAR
jgi:hypothetical protein